MGAPSNPLHFTLTPINKGARLHEREVSDKLIIQSSTTTIPKPPIDFASIFFINKTSHGESVSFVVYT